ncbi:MAG: hypothetical protein WBO19_03295, partial [Terriglobia bacterium]
SSSAWVFERTLRNLGECCHSDPALRERNLALQTEDLRDSSSSRRAGLLGMTGSTGFSASL